MTRLTPILLLVPMGASAWSSSANADEIILKNGGRLRGTIIEEDPDDETQIKLLSGRTRMVKSEDVKEIRYDESTRFVEKRGESVEEADEETEASPPGKRKRRHTGKYWDSPPDDARPKAPEKEVEGARKMVTAGVALSAIGWVGAITGAIFVGLAATETAGVNDKFIGAGLAPMFLCTGIGITGSALLGVGLRQRRELHEMYDMRAESSRERDHRWADLPSTAPGLTLTLTL